MSRETKFSGVNGDKEIFPCSADHVNRIGNLLNDDKNNNCCSVYPQLLPVIRAP